MLRAQLRRSKCNLLSFCWCIVRLAVPEVVSEHTALYAHMEAKERLVTLSSYGVYRLRPQSVGNEAVVSSLSSERL